MFTDIAWTLINVIAFSFKAGVFTQDLLALKNWL